MQTTEENIGLGCLFCLYDMVQWPEEAGVFELNLKENYTISHRKDIVDISQLFVSPVIQPDFNELINTNYGLSVSKSRMSLLYITVCHTT